MILIIHTTRGNILATFIGLALLFTMAGVSYRIHQRDQEIADAVRDWRKVNMLEARVNRYEQVIGFYTRVKPIPLAAEVIHD